MANISDFCGHLDFHNSLQYLWKQDPPQMERWCMYVNAYPEADLADIPVYWSILAVIVISITILATSDKNDASFVFTSFSNETGWSDGTAWILGLLQSGG